MLMVLVLYRRRKSKVPKILFWSRGFKFTTPLHKLLGRNMLALIALLVSTFFGNFNDKTVVLDALGSILGQGRL